MGNTIYSLLKMPSEKQVLTEINQAESKDSTDITKDIKETKDIKDTKNIMETKNSESIASETVSKKRKAETENLDESNINSDTKKIKSSYKQVTKMTKDEEKKLLAINFEEKLLRLEKMENKEILDALCEVISLEDFTIERLVQMTEEMPDDVQKQVISFCDQVYKAKNEIIAVANENPKDENKTEKTESAKKNEDKNSIESLKDIASKITAVEVLQEAIVEGITEYAIKTDIENAMIVTIAKVGGIIEEMWKRANWIGKYKQE